MANKILKNKIKSKWKFEKDAYGDISFDTVEDGIYKELRVYPNKKNWSAMQLSVHAGDMYSEKPKRKTLKKGTKEQVEEYLRRMAGF
jgi:hypothetical protein